MKMGYIRLDVVGAVYVHYKKVLKGTEKRNGKRETIAAHEIVDISSSFFSNVQVSYIGGVSVEVMIIFSFFSNS